MKRLIIFALLCSVAALGQTTPPGSFGSHAGHNLTCSLSSATCATTGSCTEGTAGCVTVGYGITYSGSNMTDTTCNNPLYCSLYTSSAQPPYANLPGEPQGGINFYTTTAVSSLSSLNNGKPNLVFLSFGGGDVSVSAPANMFYGAGGSYPGIFYQAAIDGFNVFEFTYSLSGMGYVTSGITAGDTTTAVTIPSTSDWWPKSGSFHACVDAECVAVSSHTQNGPGGSSDTLTNAAWASNHAANTPIWLCDNGTPMHCSAQPADLKDAACKLSWLAANNVGSGTVGLYGFSHPSNVAVLLGETGSQLVDTSCPWYSSRSGWTLTSIVANSLPADTATLSQLPTICACSGPCGGVTCSTGAFGPQSAAQLIGYPENWNPPASSSGLLAGTVASPNGSAGLTAWMASINCSEVVTSPTAAYTYLRTITPQGGLSADTGGFNWTKVQPPPISMVAGQCDGNVTFPLQQTFATTGNIPLTVVTNSMVSGGNLHGADLQVAGNACGDANHACIISYAGKVIMKGSYIYDSTYGLTYSTSSAAQVSGGSPVF